MSELQEQLRDIRNRDTWKLRLKFLDIDPRALKCHDKPYLKQELLAAPSTRSGLGKHDGHCKRSVRRYGKHMYVELVLDWLSGGVTKFSTARSRGVVERLEVYVGELHLAIDLSTASDLRQSHGIDDPFRYQLARSPISHWASDTELRFSFDKSCLVRCTDSN